MNIISKVGQHLKNTNFSTTVLKMHVSPNKSSQATKINFKETVIGQGRHLE